MVLVLVCGADVMCVWVCAWHRWGYVIHGAGCTAVYAGTLVLGDLARRPMFHYYGAGFMMWEVSSYFLHFR